MPEATARPPTRKQALAIAGAVNLRAQDVPGFKASTRHDHESASESRLAQKLFLCAGKLGFAGALAEEGSKEFERRAGPFKQGISSQVTVMRTAALANKDLTAMRSGRMRACVSQYLDQVFNAEKHRGVTISPVSIAHGSPPAPGTSGSFGWRLSASISTRGLRIPFYMDILGFVHGATETSLYSSGIPEPFPAATEERLFSLLVKRAKAAGG
jgi:hypothetical protein